MTSLKRCVAGLGCLAITGTAAQSPTDGPVLAARHVSPTASFTIWSPAGHVRVVAWSRDSVLIRGTPQDADVSTISGTLDIAATTVLRGQFSSVSGDIHYAGSPAPSGIYEFSNHSGSVDLLLPRSASATFSLSSIVGSIQNGFS